MTPTLHYSRECPPEIRAALEPILTSYLYLVPTWCHEIWVRYTDDDADAALSVTPVPEYRFARLYVHPSWLIGKDSLRKEQVVHEFLHISLDVLTTFLKDLTDRLCAEDDILKGWAQDQLRQRFEGVVCDLTRAVHAA